MTEKEVVLASEEVQRRNINAMLAHGNETRKIVRELEKQLDAVKGTVREQAKTIAELRNMLVKIQMVVYRGGT